jgi:hypothetical protein
MKERSLHFRWRRTFPDAERRDYVAEDPGWEFGTSHSRTSKFARTYWVEGGPERGQWVWFVNTNMAIGNGLAPSAQEAARQAEAVYLRWKAGVLGTTVAELISERAPNSLQDGRQRARLYLKQITVRAAFDRE